MARYFLSPLAAIALLPTFALAQPATGSYHVVSATKVGGDGGWDDIHADAVGRRLYIPRSEPSAHLMVFDLDFAEIRWRHCRLRWSRRGDGS